MTGDLVERLQSSRPIYSLRSSGHSQAAHRFGQLPSSFCKELTQIPCPSHVLTVDSAPKSFGRRVRGWRSGFSAHVLWICQLGFLGFLKIVIKLGGVRIPRKFRLY